MSTPLLPKTLFQAPKLRIAAALRDSLSKGYGRKALRADVLAGVVVGIVALPLSMALAIASGVPPQHGLFTAIIAGGLIATFGGSRTQISGPTAAFIAILAPITAEFGLGGLMVATMMAGILLILMAYGGMGRLIGFIPYPVTMGFTAGIGLVIATSQVKDFLGLSVGAFPSHFIEQIGVLIGSSSTLRPYDLGIGLLTLGLLVLWPRLSRRLPTRLETLGRVLPAPLVALSVAALAAYALDHLVSGAHVVNLLDKFPMQHGIPQAAPHFAVPWSFPDASGQPLVFSIRLLNDLLRPAIAIAMLGAIESLLSATIADGLTSTRHDPDAELFGQGLGNLAAPFFGGIAATGAIARTGTNIRAGGRTPVAGIVHSVFVLLAMLAFSPLLNHLPMASMAALLLLVAWNMAELPHVVHTIRHAPRSDVTVLLVCFGATVLFDMVIAVVAGVLLACLLFMKRMADVSEIRLVPSAGASPADLHNPERLLPERPREMPRGVIHYDVGGPLFFGAAQKAMDELSTIDARHWAVVLDLEDVPAIDATGLVSLGSTLKHLARHNTVVVFSGLRPQPRHALERSGLLHDWGHVALCDSIAEATALLHDCAPSDAELSGRLTPASDLLARGTPARGVAHVVDRLRDRGEEG